MTEYTLDDAKEFLEAARDNCRSKNLHLPFAIYLSHIARGVFERYNRVDFIEESEAVIERARERIKRKYKVRLFREIEAMEDENQRKEMDKFFFQVGDEFVKGYMLDHLSKDKGFKELVELCLCDGTNPKARSRLEAKATALELILGERNAA